MAAATSALLDAMRTAADEPMVPHAAALTVPEPAFDAGTCTFHVPSAWRMAATQVVPRDPLTPKETFQARSKRPPEAVRTSLDPSSETVADVFSPP